MKKILFPIIALALIIACNNETGSQPAVKDSLGTTLVPPPTEDTILSGCYSMIKNKDTASLQLQRKGSVVTGSLTYNLFQKDRNVGTFEGEISNDIITGWYLFKSEGVMSVRQLMFKTSDGIITPANGEVIMRGDSAIFKNPSAVSFDTAQAFLKVPCVI